MGVLALFVGVRFVVRTDVRADKVSFYWYNVSNPRQLRALRPISSDFVQLWLCSAYILPAYYRLQLAL